MTDTLKSSHPKQNYVPFIAMVYSSFQILANLMGIKIVDIMGMTITAGLVVFPITYIISDIMTEVYGLKVARRIIWYGLATNLLFVLAALGATALPPSKYFDNQAAFDTVFSTTPRILLASVMGYLAGEFSNATIVAKIKAAMHGKHFWLRALLSTCVGTFLDSSIFCFIAFYTIYLTVLIAEMILIQCAIKFVYEVIALPITYSITNYLKRVENSDVYDYAVT
jgi:uncharacterized integral membrane protein (TIGR00697 family)